MQMVLQLVLQLVWHAISLIEINISTLYLRFIAVLIWNVNNQANRFNPKIVQRSECVSS